MTIKDWLSHYLSNRHERHELALTFQIASTHVTTIKWPESRWIAWRLFALIVSSLVLANLIVYHAYNRTSTDIALVWATHLVSLCTWLFFLFSFVITFKVRGYLGANPHYRVDAPRYEDIPGGLPMIWACRGIRIILPITLAGGVVTMANFWLVQWELTELAHPNDWEWSFFTNLAVHGLLELILLIDYWANAHDLSYMSVIPPAIYAVFYAIYTVFYELANAPTTDGESEADEFNHQWTKWKSNWKLAAIVCVLTIAVSMAIQALFVFAKRRMLRNRIPMQYWRRKTRDQMENGLNSGDTKSDETVKLIENDEGFVDIGGNTPVMIQDMTGTRQDRGVGNIPPKTIRGSRVIFDRGYSTDGSDDTMHGMSRASHPPYQVHVYQYPGSRASSGGGGGAAPPIIKQSRRSSRSLRHASHVHSALMAMGSDNEYGSMYGDH